MTDTHRQNTAGGGGDAPPRLVFNPGGPTLKQALTRCLLALRDSAAEPHPAGRKEKAP